MHGHWAVLRASWVSAYECWVALLTADQLQNHDHLTAFTPLFTAALGAQALLCLLFLPFQLERSAAVTNCCRGGGLMPSSAAFPIPLFNERLCTSTLGEMDCGGYRLLRMEGWMPSIAVVWVCG